jgi:hypothetical protein
MTIEFGTTSKSGVKKEFGKTDLGVFVLNLMDNYKLRKVKTSLHNGATKWFAEDMNYAFFRNTDNANLKQLGTFEVEGEFSGISGNKIKIGNYKIPKECILIKWGISFGGHIIAINYFDWSNNLQVQQNQQHGVLA